MQESTQHSGSEKEAVNGTVKDSETKRLSAISHEIRTPMNVIMGVTRLLQAHNLPQHKQQELLSTLQTSANHLMNMMESLLASIRPQAHTIDLDKIDLHHETQQNKVYEQEHKKPGRILVVEDSEPNAFVAGSHLKLFGYSYDIAHNGREAVEMSGKTGYDLILMDVQMPEMDGCAASTAIRSREVENGSRRIPIIGMTACALVGDREKCLLSGMDNYISKPFDAEELKIALETYALQK